ncbi:hypothetical protein [Bacteroides neonati]|uniref:hypothetical protein n=1 Tax=Bacteroides neonati TaxID=1347393 RepID=UPI0004ADA326|nr:hypothetical protein [Bacteroides neonati]
MILGIFELIKWILIIGVPVIVIIGILGFCGVFGSVPNKTADAVNDQTVLLTDSDVKKSLSYMDKELASQYRKAIKGGQTEFRVGKGLVEQWNKQKSVDAVFSDINKDTKRLIKENKVWSDEFSNSMGSRSEAVALEKSGELMAAIEIYEECVQSGISSKKMNILNYAYDIDRLAILYRKTKQKEKEIDFLSDMIKKHPRYEEVHKWEERLSKLEK